MRKLFILLVALLQACSTAELKDSSITRLLIESHTTPCQGLVLQQCYLVKEGEAIPIGEWTFFMKVSLALTIYQDTDTQSKSKRLSATLSYKM